ncbi:MAG TPA: ATPase, partial [Methanomicrobiales archaeon]|nr:ATPase [Methanomicrobiales archaeon]
VGLAGLGTGLAEAGIGAAAVGATAENRDLFGLSLIFTVLPETIVIFGLVIALLMLF